MSIQQNQQSIHGYFLDKQAHGVRVQEPFLGIVDAPDQVQFSVVKEKEHITLSFNGLIQPDGTLGGSYCSLNSEGQCAGERGGYGVWSAIPVSGRAFIGSGDTKLYAFNASGFTTQLSILPKNILRYTLLYHDQVLLPRSQPV